MGFALPADFCVWAPTTRCRTGMPFFGGCEPCGGLWSGGAAPLGSTRRRVRTEGTGREKRPTRPGRQCFAPIFICTRARYVPCRRLPNSKVVLWLFIIFIFPPFGGLDLPPFLNYFLDVFLAFILLEVILFFSFCFYIGFLLKGFLTIYIIIT